MKTPVTDLEYKLKRLGHFYDTKEGGTAFKSRKGEKFYWLEGEEYGQFLERVYESVNPEE